MTTAALTTQFVRDKLCWLCYLMIGNYCYIAAGMGPAMSFLSAEHHLSYSVAALHFTAWSLGVLIAGTMGDKVMRRFGKPNTVWMMGSGLCGGTLIFLAGQNPVVTICGSFICGVNGSLMSQSLCTLMADKFAEARVVAISEANFVASIFCSMAPFLIGTIYRFGFNWRIAIVLPIILFLLFFMFGKDAIASEHEGSAKKTVSSEGLPKFYWLCWILVMLSVACEWSIIYWGADFLEKISKLSKADAATNVSAFLVAMVVGRFFGSRLVRIYSTAKMLRAASILSLIGFFTFWLSSYAPLNVFGLALTGLGIANFYPLTLSAAIGSAPKQASKATSRMSMASGGATLLAPLLLGLFAERSSIFTAYGLIGVLLMVCAAIVFAFNWKPRS